MSKYPSYGAQRCIQQSTRGLAFRSRRLPDVKTSVQYEVAMEEAFPLLITGEDDKFIIDLLSDARLHKRWPGTKCFEFEYPKIGGKVAEKARLTLYRGKKLAQTKIFVHFSVCSITLTATDVHVVSKAATISEANLQKVLPESTIRRLDELQRILELIIKL